MSYFGNSEFLIEVAKGNVAGHSVVHKFGAMDSADTTLQPISWDGTFRTPTTTATIYVTSTDVNDTAAGTGAREVTVEYLDSSFVEQTGTIATNGTSQSTGSISGVLRINRAYVSDSGTYASLSAPSQIGEITIHETGGTPVWTTLPVFSSFGAGQSLQALYTVPAGKTAYVLSQTITIDSGKTGEFLWFKRENADDVTTPYSGIMRVGQVLATGTGVVTLQHRTAEMYPEKTDIGYMVKAGAASTACAAEFEILLVDN